MSVLQLQQEVLLNSRSRWLCYIVVHCTARLLPAAVIYGGTAGLLVCAVCSYRWGVLVSLTLYTLYLFMLSLSFMGFAFVGLVRVWLQSRERWYAKYCRENEKVHSRPSVRSREKDLSNIRWHDVIHVVMVLSYTTPFEVLEETLLSLERYSLARTNLGVCLAFEEREAGVAAKAAHFQARFEGRFRFVVTSFHPPNIPGHVPGKSSNECWAFRDMVSTASTSGWSLQSSTMTRTSTRIISRP